jgi:hypothetical protein
MLTPVDATIVGRAASKPEVVNRSNHASPA